MDLSLPLYTALAYFLALYIPFLHSDWRNIRLLLFLSSQRYLAPSSLCIYFPSTDWFLFCFGHSYHNLYWSAVGYIMCLVKQNSMQKKGSISEITIFSYNSCLQQNIWLYWFKACVAYKIVRYVSVSCNITMLLILHP